MEHVHTDREKYLAAKTQVKALKGFYIHLAVFAGVMTGLLALDYAGGGSWWVQWPLLGWGAGVLGHAYLVFSPRSATATTWEERKIQEVLNKK